MAEPIRVNPHILCLIKGMDQGDSTLMPPRTPTVQVLRAEHDLGLYTVEELGELLKEVEVIIGEWVTNNPPFDPEA